MLGFATIVAVIGVGALVAHLGIVDLGAQQVLSRIAFFVASPALLLTTVAEADTHGVLSRSLVATAVGVVVPAAVYVGVAWWRWRRSVGERVIGALASSYVNAGNLGLPVAAYVLGDAALVAPTLLMQLLVLQPVALAVLDADVRGHRPTLRQVLVRPFTNPLTIGTLIGLLLSVTGWTLPPIVLDPIELIGAMAVPAMLLAYGIALRLGPGFGGEVPAAELALTSTLKLAVQPLVAYAVAHLALGLSGPALLAVVVCSSLPTAQNVFVHATRYDRSPTLARDTILVTTVGCGAAHHARGLAARLTSWQWPVRVVCRCPATTRSGYCHLVRAPGSLMGSRCPKGVPMIHRALAAAGIVLLATAATATSADAGVPPAKSSFTVMTSFVSSPSDIVAATGPWADCTDVTDLSNYANQVSPSQGPVQRREAGGLRERRRRHPLRRHDELPQRRRASPSAAGPSCPRTTRRSTAAPAPCRATRAAARTASSTSSPAGSTDRLTRRARQQGGPGGASSAARVLGENDRVITVELARAVLDAGVLWEPAAGDRFVIDAELLTGEVFWISDLTVEVQTYRDQSLLGFNGTTEWALDSVTLDQALWLPREDQLRELLGDRLEAVRRLEQGWEVTYAVKQGYVRTVTDADLECAYARALVTL